MFGGEKCGLDHRDVGDLPGVVKKAGLQLSLAQRQRRIHQIVVGVGMLQAEEVAHFVHHRGQQIDTRGGGAAVVGG